MEIDGRTKETPFFSYILVLVFFRSLNSEIGKSL